MQHLIGRAVWGRVITVFLAAGIAFAQEPGPNVEQPQGSGIGLTEFSTYVTRLSNSGSDSVAGSPLSRPILVGGLSASGGWHETGRTAAATLDYVLNYTWNDLNRTFNGFDHEVRLGIRTGQNRRVGLAIGVTAEQHRLSSALFEPLGVVTLARSGSFSNLTDSLADIRNGGTSFAPALDLWLFGQNMRSLEANTTLTWSQSRRLSWYSTLSAERMLPLSTADAGPGAGFSYHGVTSGTGGGGFQYELSRRTSLGGSASYGRSESSLASTSIATGGFNLSRYLNEHLFAYGAVGYDVMQEFRAEDRSVMHSYDASAGVGVRHGSQTVVLLVHRGLSSHYGLGAMRSEAGEVVWNWTPAGRLVMFSASGNYSRLTGVGERLQGWSGRFGMSRRLSRRVQFNADAVYAGVDGLAFNGARALAIRFGFSWIPMDLWQ
jgi:hypothetical protein